MKNFLVRSVSAIVLVWIMLEATASENAWYYVLWGVIGAGSIAELLYLLIKHPVDRGWLWAFFGSLYIGLAMFIAMLMAGNWQLMVVLLTIVWANDVGAYIVGVTIGKHKMASKISPKKSWEGFFGGLLFGVSVAAVWWELYFSPMQVVDLNTIDMRLIWGGLGLIGALAAVVGDLLESKFKRVVGVKDSGNVIPGHGGMLDRFDALYLAIIVSTAYMAITGII